MNYWLLKSEPITYSIDHLKTNKIDFWDGVRNYQARNYLKAMNVGDLFLFYHSVTDPIGIAGIAKIVKTAYPDPTQFDKNSKYFDPKATKEKPIWFCPEVKFVEKFKNILPLPEIKKYKELQNMPLLQKGSRLSVQPVTENEFTFICDLVQK